MKRLGCLLLALILAFCLPGCGNKKNESTQNVVSNNNVDDEARDTYYNTFENFKSTFKTNRMQDTNYVIKSSDDYAAIFTKYMIMTVIY